MRSVTVMHARLPCGHIAPAARSALATGNCSGRSREETKPGLSAPCASRTRISGAGGPPGGRSWQRGARQAAENPGQFLRRRGGHQSATDQAPPLQGGLAKPGGNVGEPACQAGKPIADHCVAQDLGRCECGGIRIVPGDFGPHRASPVITECSEADGQALHNEQATTLLTLWIVDHLRRARSPAVLDGHSHSLTFGRMTSNTKWPPRPLAVWRMALAPSSVAIQSTSSRAGQSGSSDSSHRRARLS